MKTWKAKNMRKLFFTIILFLSLAAFQITAISSSVSETESVKYWNKVLLNRQKKISYFRDEISTITTFVEQRNAYLRDAILATEVKYQELKFILLTGTKSPYRFRLAIKKLTHLYDIFNSQLQYAKEIQTSLQYQLAVYDEATDTLLRLDRENVSPELKESISLIEKDISKIMLELKTSKEKLTNTINEADALFNLAKKDKKNFDKIMLKQLKLYFLTSSDSLESNDTWQLSEFHIKLWGNTAYDTLIEKVPDSKKEWLHLLLFIVAGLIIFIAGKYIYKKLFKNKVYKLICSTWFWFIFAITLVSFNHIVMNFPENLVTYVLSTACIIRGIMKLS